MMQRMAIFRRPRHQQHPGQRPIVTPTERRRAKRHPLDLPLRLRLGNDLFPGHASDLSAGGIGLWLIPQPDTADILDHALAGHERGALELLLGDIRLVARVRIAHVRFLRGGTYIGLAIDDSEEAERLIRRLEACCLSLGSTAQ